MGNDIVIHVDRTVLATILAVTVVAGVLIWWARRWYLRQLAKAKHTTGAYGAISPGESSEMEPAKVRYNFILAAVGVFGLCCVGYAGAHRHVTEEHIGDSVLVEIGHIVPGLLATQQSAIRKTLTDWEGHIQPETFPDLVWRDIGMALCLAVVLSLILEQYARSRLQGEIRSGVIEAAFKRLIPAAVFDQVRVHVLSAKVVKENWAVEINVRREDALTQVDKNLLFATTILRYQLRSLTGSVVRGEPIKLGIDSDRRVQCTNGTVLPQIKSVEVGMESYKGINLTKKLNPEGTLFKTTADIDVAPVIVTMILEEAIRVPDTFCWTTSICTTDAMITIDATTVQDVEFDVSAMHPDQERIVNRVAGRTWEFPIGLLPWQGFEVVTKWLPQPSPPSSPGTPPAGATVVPPASPTTTGTLAASPATS
ncbi:hypothetical protein tb265_11800 [Gemmatimonadetes bacterium T265]|nr:hypothetical protein tb265_11800 [Gemmatimonadetes bacterium T265]